MVSTAKITPRLKPIVGAELGPVIAARKPILIGSEAAIAGFGSENVATPSAPALPSNNSRRETAICFSLNIFSALVVPASLPGYFSSIAKIQASWSNLNQMWTTCPELPAYGVSSLRPRSFDYRQQLNGLLIKAGNIVGHLCWPNQ
jgi:hypothetical protein